MMMVANIDSIHAYVGVTNEVPAYHPFVANVSSERIAHSSVATSQTDTITNGGLKTFAFVFRECAECPAGKYHIERVELGNIGKNTRGAGYLDRMSTLR